MKWEIGDRLRVLNASAILGRENAIRDNGVYKVIDVYSDGTPIIFASDGDKLSFYRTEMQFVERVADTVYTEDYEMSDAELGEPSEAPNVTLSEIYEEVLDMKAMIGRLIRNGEES